jgi:hypothetical protein
MSSDKDGTNKRKGTFSTPVADPSGIKRGATGPGSVPQRPNPLHALLTSAPNEFMSFLSMDEAATLSRVSKTSHAAVQTHSALPAMQGKRIVNGTSLWSSDPVTSDKRYFKPTSAVGTTQSVPHLSEQRGFDTHLTDIASMQWNSGLGSQLKPGLYPTKVQVPRVSSMPDGYRLGAANLPAKPSDGRVLVAAPPLSKEPSGTFIETKSFNKASTGPLPQSYPRTQLSSGQVSQKFSDLRAKWENASVKVRERPGS